MTDNNEEGFYADVERLVRVIAYMQKTGSLSKLPELYELGASIGEYLETDDPRENGWVDDRGRP